MSLNVTVELPQGVEERLREELDSLEADVKEVYVLELFRRGRLSHAELAQALGLDRFETDAFLKHRGVFTGSLSMTELEADWQTLQRVMGNNT